MFNFPLQAPQASNWAVEHDWLFMTITALTIFFSVIVFALVVYFAVKYREGSSANRDNIQHENLRIEIAWSLPPLFLGFLIFLWSTHLFMRERKMPDNPMEIFVIGKQWMWHIEHANGIRENNEMHVPIGQPIKLTMISQDVIHAFYIPAFRIQYHVVPGTYTTMWFIPTKAGKYPLFCNMHCGTQHSEMGGYVTVMPPAEFAEWQANGGTEFKMASLTMEQRGLKLFNDKGCNNCHGDKDTDQGPTLSGVYGHQRKMDNGETIMADDAYMRESIVDPTRHITTGYENTMPGDYKNYFNEEQLLDLLAYMRSLTAPATVPTKPATPPAMMPGGAR